METAAHIVIIVTIAYMTGMGIRAVVEMVDPKGHTMNVIRRMGRAIRNKIVEPDTYIPTTAEALGTLDVLDGVGRALATRHDGSRVIPSPDADRFWDGAPRF